MSDPTHSPQMSCGQLMPPYDLISPANHPPLGCCCFRCHCRCQCQSAQAVAAAAAADATVTEYKSDEGLTAEPGTKRPKHSNGGHHTIHIRSVSEIQLHTSFFAVTPVSPPDHHPHPTSSASCLSPSLPNATPSGRPMSRHKRSVKSAELTPTPRVSNLTVHHVLDWPSSPTALPLPLSAAAPTLPPAQPCEPQQMRHISPTPQEAVDSISSATMDDGDIKAHGDRTTLRAVIEDQCALLRTTQPTDSADHPNLMDDDELDDMLKSCAAALDNCTSSSPIDLAVSLIHYLNDLDQQFDNSKQLATCFVNLVNQAVNVVNGVEEWWKQRQDRSSLCGENLIHSSASTSASPWQRDRAWHLLIHSGAAIDVLYFLQLIDLHRIDTGHERVSKPAIRSSHDSHTVDRDSHPLTLLQSFAHHYKLETRKDVINLLKESALPFAQYHDVATHAHAQVSSLSAPTTQLPSVSLLSRVHALFMRIGPAHVDHLLSYCKSLLGRATADKKLTFGRSQQQGSLTFATWRQFEDAVTKLAQSKSQ